MNEGSLTYICTVLKKFGYHQSLETILYKECLYELFTSVGIYLIICTRIVKYSNQSGIPFLVEYLQRNE